MNAVKTTALALFGVVVVLFAASGCTPMTTPAIPTSTPAPAPTATAPAAGILDGVYAIDTYKLKFQGSHFTLLTEFDQEWAQGHFAINGNQITFTDEDFAPECGPETSPYTYGWAFDGKALTFSNPGDKCEGRSSFMLEKPWIFKGPTQ